MKATCICHVVYILRTDKIHFDFDSNQKMFFYTVAVQKKTQVLQYIEYT